MSARRWSVLVAFVTVSLLLSVGWSVWSAVRAPPGNRMAAVGIVGIIQLLEIPLAYYLLRLSDYAHYWTLRFNLIKFVSALGFATGVVIGRGAGVESAAPLVAVAGFYAAYTLFLWRNAEFFD